MKKLRGIKTIGAKSVTLAQNHVIAIKGKAVRIECLQGYLWVTWPECHERVLKDGQAMCLNANGKICILALSPSRIQICETTQGLPSVGLSYGQCSA